MLPQTNKRIFEFSGIIFLNKFRFFRINFFVKIQHHFEVLSINKFLHPYDLLLGQIDLIFYFFFIKFLTSFLVARKNKALCVVICPSDDDGLFHVFLKRLKSFLANLDKFIDVEGSIS